MNIKKVVIANNILISFDEFDNAVDIFDLSKIKIGYVFKATVEKIIPKLNACFVKIDEINEKGFVELKNINPENFITKHSTQKLIVQDDQFYVKIIKEKKLNKPYSCSFVETYEDNNYPFLKYYFSEIGNNFEIISNQIDICNTFSNSRYYFENNLALDYVYDFKKNIDNALSNRIYLKNDSDIVIQSTEGLTVIDVNFGRGKNNKDYFTINRLAAEEIGRQLRLRNISGIVVIDFLKDDNKDHQLELKKILKMSTIDDYCQVDVYDFTKLGLLELTRSRKLSPLFEYFR